MKKTFCVISDDRAYKSKSPLMMNNVFSKTNIDGYYIPAKVSKDSVYDAVKGLVSLGFSGANVTVPYKNDVIAALDWISDDAKSVSAVNTILNKDGRLEGYNTDIGGFLDTLAELSFATEGKRVLMFGTGGAASGLIAAFQKGGFSQITVAGRSVEKLETLSSRNIETVLIDDIKASDLSYDLIVNATAVSTKVESADFCSTIDNLNVKDCKLVVDINYGRKDSFWEKLAVRIGAAYEDGLLMLAAQARLSFEIWLDIKPDLEYFLTPLRESIGK
ncbi:MAG: shikimate dehydrogenase [Kiritimatiellae bacterium]|jgi:shikimate dehydrogenase|nr:shikimate dehydrogenase [Kiritimatiellia bacterium]